MTIESKIKQRINKIANINGLLPSKILISDEEAKELGNINEIYGVKLIVAGERKQQNAKWEIRQNCYFYNKEGNDCNKFKELFCANKECRFYKKRNELSMLDIEKSIRDYAVGRN